MNNLPANLISQLNLISSQKRVKIFTWHIHGSYLYYLSQGKYDIYIPVNDKRDEGYYGRGETFPFGNNVHEIPAESVKEIDFDCILFQTNKNYLIDQYEVLSKEQRELPKIYLEHDPPIAHPTDTKHIVNDPNMVLVHVTHFNRLMWDNNKTPTCVIEHGVTMPTITYKGDLNRGLVVINNLPKRGRLLGLDLFLEVRKHIPLDIIGLGAEELGGKEVLHPNLGEFISHYRFFFNPIRYTSMGLAVIEAMMIGVPVACMDTTELSTVIRNGTNGYIHTDIDYLIGKMKRLLDDKKLAYRMGSEGQATALENFNIKRFTNQWQFLFNQVIQSKVTGSSLSYNLSN